jgi:ankyrin repeat protein
MDSDLAAWQQYIAQCYGSLQVYRRLSVITLLQQMSSSLCSFHHCCTSHTTRSLECLKVLLEAGANVTARDMDKATPLQIAARLGKLQAVVSNSTAQHNIGCSTRLSTGCLRALSTALL